MTTLLGLIVLALWSCDDPTEVGSTILTDDDLPIKVVELDVDFTQQKGNAITTYQAPGTSQLNHGQSGIIQDNIFGRTEASFSMQMRTISKFVPDNTNRIVDSVVLYLYLDSTSTYGPLTTQKIEVLRLDQSIDGLNSYEADEELSVGSSLGTFTINPSYTISDTNEAGPFVRFELSNDLGAELFMLDSFGRANDSAFIENFKGFQIRTTEPSDCLLGFKPYRSTDQNVNTSLRVFYRDSLTQDTSLTLIIAPTFRYFATPVIQHYQYDYTGSLVQDYLDSPSDSLLFIQGNGGVNIDLSIPDITSLGGAVINKAELFVPFNTKILPYSDHRQLKTIFMTYETLGGSQQFIPEFFETATFQFSPLGRLDTVGGEIGYAYNIPVHGQNLIDNAIFKSKIRLQSVFVSTDSDRRSAFGPANLAESSARSVVLGQRSLSEAVRLKISYTEN